MRPVRVQRVPIAAIEGCELASFCWCNTNNHRDTKKGKELTDEAYCAAVSATHFDKWFPVLRGLGGDRFDKCHVVRVSAEQIQRFLKPARQAAQNGVSAAQLFHEELATLAAELIEAQPPLAEGPSAAGWFVRTDSCSPKDAELDGGAGPHRSLLEVLIAVAGSQRCHAGMGSYRVTRGPGGMSIYLMPFDCEVTTRRELRVFVDRGVVTAFTQYSWTDAESVFCTMSDRALASVAWAVDAFQRTSVHPLWTAAGGVASYVMDVECVVAKGTVAEDEACVDLRLIELNSFGAELAAASGLFHWVRDATLLYRRDREAVRGQLQPLCARVLQAPSGSVTGSRSNEALVHVLHHCSYCGRNAFAADFVGQPVRAMDAYLQKHISGSCVAV